MKFAKRHSCQLCQSTYGRLEHLKRHISVAHNVVEPFQCPGCQKQFTRRDVLKRHQGACKASENPRSNGRRGQHRTACRECIQQKRACGVERPCHNCIKSNRECEPYHQPSTNQTSDPELVTISSMNQPLLLTAELKNRSAKYHQTVTRCTIQPLNFDRAIPLTLHVDVQPAISFDFLLTFTKGQSLLVSFEASKLFIEYSSSQLLLGSSQSSMSNLPSVNFQILQTSQPSFSEIEESGRYLWCSSPHPEKLVQRDSRHDLEYSCSENIASALEPSVASNDCFVQKCSEIIIGLKHSNSSTWNDITDVRCWRFFRPYRVVAFIKNYWDVWYPNWPVIHKPTFDVSRCPKELLAAMFIIGACHSPDKEDRLEASMWFVAVETMVFDNVRVSADNSHHSHRQILTRQLRRLQAAYCVCVFQNWDGDVEGRQRTRNYHFNTVIAMTREMLASYPETTKQFNLEASNFVWIDFIFREEIVRTITWVFLLDTSFTIFRNMPPRLALRELKLGLTTPESCFQAESASICEQNLKEWMSRTPERKPFMDVYSLIIAFCQKKMSVLDMNWCAHQGFMNLWVVISAIHILLYHIEPPLQTRSQFQPIQTGLENWKAIWNVRLMRKDEHHFDVQAVSVSESYCYHTQNVLAKDGEGERMISQQSKVSPSKTTWKRVGFWKHASEYWLLAEILLNQMISWQRSTEAAELLSGAEGIHSRVSPRILDYFGDEESCISRLHEFLATI